MKEFFRRVGIFCGLFVLVSGIIGSWLVPTRLLYSFGFYLYGNLGKMVLLGAVMLGVMTREHLGKLKWPKWEKGQIRFLAAALMAIPPFFILAKLLLRSSQFSDNILLAVTTHLVLITIPLLLALGILGTKFMSMCGKKFKKEIIICMALAIIFDAAIFQVWKLWPFFSAGVLMSVRALLSLSFGEVTFSPPYTLMVNDFGVSIQQACSGLDSLFMFTALYIFIALVDYKKLNLKRMAMLYPVAILGMYMVNIFRVYILIVIGATVSPTLALNLFHTYAGMILFILYFGGFWKMVGLSRTSLS